MQFRRTPVSLSSVLTAAAGVVSVRSPIAIKFGYVVAIDASENKDARKFKKHF